MTRLLSLLLTLLLTLLPLCSPAADFDLQAHRGGRGLRPENTLAAFENAIRMGVTTLELDIAITTEGVPVISHDPFLNPNLTRDGGGAWLSAKGPKINSLSLAQVQMHDVGRINPATPYAKTFAQQQPVDGQVIPTLNSLFMLVKRLGADTVEFDIETKVFPNEPDATPAPAEFVERLLNVIREHGMVQRVMIQSFDWRTLALVGQAEPSMRRVYLTAQSATYNTLLDGRWTAGLRLQDHGNSVPALVLAAAGKSQGTTWSPAFDPLSREQVQQAQALGLRVIPWTVNQVSQMASLLDWGVDGLITDYPDRLRGLMAERGMALPAGMPK